MKAGPDRHTRHFDTLAAISAAGVAGTLCRYGLTRAMPTPASFPLGTLVVNVSGCLAIGVALVVIGQRYARLRLARPVIATGFLGGFTTFSTYVVATDMLWRDGHLLVGCLYVVGSATAGFAATAAGMVGARLWIRPRAAVSER